MGLGIEFRDGLPKMARQGLRSRLLGRSDSADPIRTPENVLMDTVADGSGVNEVWNTRSSNIGKTNLAGSDENVGIYVCQGA